MGYDADGGDEGAGEWLQLTTAPDVRSISGLFLNHRDGEIADVYLDDVKTGSVNTYGDGGSPCSGERGAGGSVLETVLATGLAGSHTIKIVNTGTVNGPAKYTGRTDRGLGRQVILDCFRTGDFDFGTIKGVVTDRAGQPLPQVRMLVDTNIGPVLDGGKTVVWTDGSGNYSLSGLTRGNSYTVTADDRRVMFSESLTVPTGGGGVLTRNFNSADYTYDVLRPRMGIPAIVQRGGTFTIEVDAPTSASNWSVRISNADISINNGVFVSATYTANGILNNTKDGWVITGQIPGAGITHENAGAPCEVYDIQVSCSLGDRVESHAVSVIEDYSADFYIAQITDLHLYSANLVKCLPVLEIINPRFVAVTGDLVDYGGGQLERFKYRTDANLGAETAVPLVFTTGNHDVSDLADNSFHLALWDTVMVQREFSLSMGPVYVMSHDFSTANSAWATAEWNSAYGNPNYDIRIILQHMKGNFVPASGKAATIILAGHNHQDQYEVNNGTPCLTTKAMETTQNARIVRFKKQSGHLAMTTFSYPNGTGAPSMPLLAGSPLAAQVTRAYSSKNDGSATHSTVTIKNTASESFENCRARFVMARGAYTVVSGNGHIVDSYDSTSSATIVLAEVSVAANAQSTLEIKQGGAAGVAWKNDPFSKPDAMVDGAYVGSISGDASGGTGTLTFSRVSGPDWLGVASDGGLSGTPGSGDLGLNAFTVRVTDSGGAYDDATMNITVVSAAQITFTSIGGEDGYINESGENTNIGGYAYALGTGASGLRVGDLANGKQIKTIVSFDTSPIPDGATIASAQLRLLRGALTGTNDPFTWGGACHVDIKNGGFSGNVLLEPTDFEAPADTTQVATMSSPASDGSWSEGTFSTGLNQINKTGKTQLRVYFETDDNNNLADDYMGFYSGDNATTSNWPQLVIAYQTNDIAPAFTSDTLVQGQRHSRPGLRRFDRRRRLRPGRGRHADVLEGQRTQLAERGCRRSAVGHAGQRRRWRQRLHRSRSRRGGSPG